MNTNDFALALKDYQVSIEEYNALSKQDITIKLKLKLAREKSMKARENLRAIEREMFTI